MGVILGIAFLIFIFYLRGKFNTPASKCEIKKGYGYVKTNPIPTQSIIHLYSYLDNLKYQDLNGELQPIKELQIRIQLLRGLNYLNIMVWKVELHLKI